MDITSVIIFFMDIEKGCIRTQGTIRQSVSRFLQHEVTWSIFTPPPPVPPYGMLAHRRDTPSIKFAASYLNTWVERGTVRVRCLAQEHNTMSPAKAPNRTAHSETSALTMPPHLD